MVKNSSDLPTDKMVYSLKEYISSYQYSVRALIRSMTMEEYDTTNREFLMIGDTIIWPCKDAAAVLIKDDSKNEINIHVNQAEPIKIYDFMTKMMTEYHDIEGNTYKAKFVVMVQAEDKDNIDIWWCSIKPQLPLGNGKVAKPNYDSYWIVGWDAILPPPDDQALKNFKSAYLPKNLLTLESGSLPSVEAMVKAAKSGKEILRDFRNIILEKGTEEAIQKYLSQHPQLIYPHYIKCLPKFKLGEDFVTDFVFLVHGHNGPEYVFVEIEKPAKKVFTKSGFSAGFTQAKGQLLDWDNWITKNHSYVTNKLPGLFKPKFHLIMGNTDINQVQRERIESDFIGNRMRFSSFIDLAERFDRLLSGIT